MAATKVRKRDTGESGNKGEFGTLHRGESQVEVEIEPEKQVEYSFLEKFEEMAEQYEHDFEGFPKSFANADLRGKYLPAPGGDPAREARRSGSPPRSSTPAARWACGRSPRPSGWWGGRARCGREPTPIMRAGA